MSEVTGVVEAVSQRGKGFNIKVGDAWYGFGFEDPSEYKGRTVSFGIKMNGRYANVDNNNFNVVPTTEASAVTSYKASAGMDQRQKSICWQSARNAAIEVAKFSAEQGIATLGTTKAKKYDTFLALIDSITERFYADLEQLDATGEAPTQAESASVADELDEEEG